MIEYLNQQEGVPEFLGHTASLVEASIDNYQKRGFSNLMISYGCTGGRHRSVYFAEQLAKHLSDRKDIQVLVRHLELEKIVK